MAINKQTKTKQHSQCSRVVYQQLFLYQQTNGGALKHIAGCLNNQHTVCRAQHTDTATTATKRQTHRPSAEGCSRWHALSGLVARDSNLKHTHTHHDTPIGWDLEQMVSCLVNSYRMRSAWSGLSTNRPHSPGFLMGKTIYFLILNISVGSFYGCSYSSVYIHTEMSNWISSLAWQISLNNTGSEECSISTSKSPA